MKNNLQVATKLKIQKVKELKLAAVSLTCRVPPCFSPSDYVCRCSSSIFCNCIFCVGQLDPETLDLERMALGYLNSLSSHSKSEQHLPHQQQIITIQAVRLHANLLCTAVICALQLMVHLLY